MPHMKAMNAPFHGKTATRYENIQIPSVVESSAFINLIEARTRRNMDKQSRFEGRGQGKKGPREIALHRPRTEDKKDVPQPRHTTHRICILHSCGR